MASGEATRRKCGNERPNCMMQLLPYDALPPANLPYPYQLGEGEIALSCRQPGHHIVIRVHLHARPWADNHGRFAFLNDSGAVEDHSRCELVAVVDRAIDIARGFWEIGRAFPPAHRPHGG